MVFTLIPPVLQINGISLAGREHKHVVDLFKTAGEDVELRVQKKVGGFPWHCQQVSADSTTVDNVKRKNPTQIDSEAVETGTKSPLLHQKHF